MNKSSLRRMLLRAGAVASAMAVAAGVAVVGGAGVATASAGTACASGYVCVFARAGNTDGWEQSFSTSSYNYANVAWGSYEGGWHIIYGTTVDDDIDAVNYNWQNSPVSFWEDPAYKGKEIAHYLSSERGYRNWTGGNINSASSHENLYR